MDRTLKSTEEVERILAVPVLATVPDVSNESRSYGVLGRYGYGYGYGYGERKARPTGKAARVRRKRGDPDEEVKIELLPLHRPRLAVSEAYRSLRTALLLSTARELKAIVVTSAVPSEGKTSTAANLAVVMAQLGKQVLLVDGDLRKPRVHEVFKISNKAGLVSYLTQGAEIEQVIFRTEVPNLHLTPSGPIPPNPSELLSSERMAQFVAFARGHFDFVIFDTAPTLAVTDGILLGSQSDGVVLCLRAGHVQRRDAKSCCDRLRQAEVKLLGVVLNRHHAIEGRYRSGYGGNYETYGAPEATSDKGKGGVAAL
jgi:capsular exopolysaccharide synthesis family protein